MNLTQLLCDLYDNTLDLSYVYDEIAPHLNNGYDMDFLRRTLEDVYFRLITADDALEDLTTIVGD